MRQLLGTVVALCALWASVPAFAEDYDPNQVAADPERHGVRAEGLEALDDVMQRYVDSGHVAGLVTLVARDGKTVSLESYGYADLDAKRPMTTDTLFRIYSMTKPVIGTAMMILYDDGKWSLDDPITKFLPEFSELKVMTGVDAEGRPIVTDVARPPTMRELMTHTAGFGYGLFGGNPVEEAFQKADLVNATSLSDMADRIDHIPLLFQPGERWSYSIGVDLQGLIIERISGKKLSVFLQERLFGPLQMTDTGFYARPDNIARLSELYYRDPVARKLVRIDPQLPNLPNFTRPPLLESGGGGLVSTAGDFARFAQMILKRGELNGVRILKPETIDLMLRDHLPADMPVKLAETVTFEGMGFGLGWGVIRDPVALKVKVGKGTVMWGGAAGTWFWVDPANDLVFVGMVQCFYGGCDTSSPVGESFFAASGNRIADALIDPPAAP